MPLERDQQLSKFRMTTLTDEAKVRRFEPTEESYNLNLSQFNPQAKTLFYF